MQGMPDNFGAEILMAALIECPSCGGLRHETSAACPHCAAAGFTKRRFKRLALAVALGSTTTACFTATVEYGPPPVCTPPDCVMDASVDAGDGGDAAIVDDGGDDAGDQDGGDGG